MTRIISVVALLLIWIWGSRSTKLPNRVVHGTVSTQFYPFIVGVFVRQDIGLGQCGGALISKRFVLTAAHCFQHILAPGEKNISGQAASKIYISAGNKCLSQCQDYNILKGKVHHWYKSNRTGVDRSYDLAILMTINPIPNLRPIDLPPLSFKDNDVYAELAGWGMVRTPDSCITSQMGPEKFKTCIQNGTQCQGNKQVDPPQSGVCKNFLTQPRQPLNTHVYNLLLSTGQNDTCFNASLSTQGWCHVDAQRTKWGFCMDSCQYTIGHFPDCYHHMNLFTKHYPHVPYDRKAEMTAVPALAAPNWACYEQQQQGNQFQLLISGRGNQFGYESYAAAAHGDSGTAIWRTEAGKAVLIGIASRGGLVEENIDSVVVAARVKAFRGWIRQSKKELERST